MVNLSYSENLKQSISYNVKIQLQTIIPPVPHFPKTAFGGSF